MSTLEKHNNKVELASDKTETKQFHFFFIRKTWDQSIIRLGNIKRKRKETAKLKSFFKAYIFKNKIFRSNENQNWKRPSELW